MSERVDRFADAVEAKVGGRLGAATLRADPLPASGRRRQLVDAVVALLFLMVVVRPALNTPNVSSPPLDVVLLAGVAAVPLAWRRRTPLAALWAQLAVDVALMALHAYPDVLFAASLVAAVALYSAVAHSPYRQLALASLPVAAVVLVLLVSRAQLPHFPNWIVGALLLFPIVAAAFGQRLWALRAEESRARMRMLELDRIEALRQAVEHERARIARELHDVVTHNVSVMVISAGAARMVVEQNPAMAKEALQAIETGGRAAMSDLRNVMGLLTMDATGSGSGEEAAAAAELAPQPGLDGLEALVSRMRLAGIGIELQVTGERRALSPGLELTAYRVVQEALTNMIKHAVGARAAIQVEYGTSELTVEVANTEGHAGAAAATGSSKGLIGLRERLALYGGTLQAGPRLTGGYRVKASIPLDLMEDA
ncbi:sensor histidine kinase [Streptacidiphilus jiangxiensis]|uniref:histidine kinase n=1 Tax=Streptacidiphilus jiangxiensis TaxID=235985 RepID=A0A1H7G5Y5_STRJI|nr:histidine kinase [Streptacidiphilus jiangxiensis]SEK32867.1 Signal transduction histidine kinase [Streptacidiphilus jiangxiensis]